MKIISKKRGRTWCISVAGASEEFEVRNEGAYWSLYSRLPGERFEAVGGAATRAQLFEEIEKRYKGR